MEIKNLQGKVFFKNDSPSIKETIEDAIRKGMSLSKANLIGADLMYANLTCADLRGAYLINASLIGANLTCANLSGADLSGANLRGVNLSNANFIRANLMRANLSGANLICAYLSGANLSDAYLSGANLSGANLSCAYLSWANLSGADLSMTNLSSTYLNGAYLMGAKNMPYVPLACPSEGSFIGWKKIHFNRNEYIVKLRIPEDARRCSATTLKCRCDKAEVLSIECLSTGDKNIKQVVNCAYSHACTYTVGEMVYPDSFDENRWDECSNGIHFFINKQNAIDY